MAPNVDVAEAVTNGVNYSEAQQVILLHSCLDALLHSHITAISSIALWSRLKAKFEPKSKNGFMERHNGRKVRTDGLYKQSAVLHWCSQEGDGTYKTRRLRAGPGVAGSVAESRASGGRLRSRSGGPEAKLG